MYMIAVNEYIIYIKCVLIQMISTRNSLFHKYRLQKSNHIVFTGYCTHSSTLKELIVFSGRKISDFLKNDSPYTPRVDYYNEKRLAWIRLSHKSGVLFTTTLVS